MALFHLRRGSGEPLLLIQGMSGTHAAWGEPFLSALEGDFDIVYYDHRGIGNSPAADGPFTLADLADDAAQVLDEVGWDSAHVMGISMGGMISQDFALRHGERIRTLTLGCTSCGPASTLADPATLQGLAAAMMSGDRDRAIRAGFDVNVSQPFADAPGNWDAFYAMATSVHAPLPTIMMQMQAIMPFNVASRIEQIDRPTLVIHGTADQMIPSTSGELVASKIPGARLELYEGVGHMFWWEEPARTAALVREHALAS